MEKIKLRSSLGTAALVLVFMVVLKPILDFTWEYKLHLFSRPLGIQGVLGFLGIFTAIGIIFVQRNKNNLLLKLYLILAIFLGLHTLFFKGQFEFTSKYLAGVSAFVFIPWAIETYNQKEYSDLIFKRVLSVVLIVIFASLAFQMLGILPWRVYDLLEEKKTGLMIEAGRLTGFYYHPLDLIRVLIWYHFGIILLLVQKIEKKKYPLYFALFGFLHFFLFRTSHRSTLIFSVVSCLCIFLYQKSFKKNLTLYACILLSIFVPWAISSLVLSKTSTLKASGAFVQFKSEYFTKSRTSIPTGKNSSLPIPTFSGRDLIWKDHINYIKNFTTKEILLGSRTAMHPKMEPEPHNQIMDWLERYGLAGLCLFISFIGFFYWQVQAPLYLKTLSLVTLSFYGVLTESFVMPTFVWWAVLFLFIPWLKK